MPSASRAAILGSKINDRVRRPPTRVRIDAERMRQRTTCRSRLPHSRAGPVIRQMLQIYSNSLPDPLVRLGGQDFKYRGMDSVSQEENSIFIHLTEKATGGPRSRGEIDIDPLETHIQVGSRERAPDTRVASSAAAARHRQKDPRPARASRRRAARQRGLSG